MYVHSANPTVRLWHSDPLTVADPAYRDGAAQTPPPKDGPLVSSVVAHSGGTRAHGPAPHDEGTCHPFAARCHEGDDVSTKVAACV